MAKRRMLLGWTAVLLVAAGGWTAYQTYKERTMPPTFVYLIPEDYRGPVFIFFDRPDGVEMQPDPLGHSVTVPPNGIVKVKALIDDVMNPGSEGHPSTNFISLSKDGVRKKMKVFVGSYRDTEKDGWYSVYIFENDTLQKFSYSDDETGKYKYFSAAVKNERMIFGRNVCDDKFNDLEGKSEGPYCGRFFVASPNEQAMLPETVWDKFHGRRNTMQEAIDEADQRLRDRTSLIPKQVQPIAE